MDAIELRRRGVELLSPVLVPYGFVYQASEVDRGSGGLYAHGGSHERTVRWNSACAMRSVRSAIASMLPRYCTKYFARAAVGRGQARYPGFSDDPLDGFRDLATDLVRFGSVFLAGTTAEFAALVTKAERTRPPARVCRALPWPSPCSAGPGRTSGRDRRGTLRRERGTRRSNVRDS